VKIHDLKCWPTEFSAVKYGHKDFEIRRDDREFATGDLVVLREFLPEPDEIRPAGYTGNAAGPYKIGYVERSACLPVGWCGFRLRKMVMKEPVE
jgi:hypothetical protein